MVIPISGPSNMYENNTSVVHNVYRSVSVLKKKSNSVCYHAVHELVAISESFVEHIPSSDNIADLTTKVTLGQKEKYLLTNICMNLWQ